MITIAAPDMLIALAILFFACLGLAFLIMAALMGLAETRTIRRVRKIHATVDPMALGSVLERMDNDCAVEVGR